MSSNPQQSENKRSESGKTAVRRHTSSVSVNTESLKGLAKQSLPTALVSLIGLLFMCYERLVTLESSLANVVSRSDAAQIQTEKAYLDLKASTREEMRGLRKVLEDQGRELTTLRVQVASGSSRD